MIKKFFTVISYRHDNVCSLNDQESLKQIFLKLIYSILKLLFTSLS